MEPGVFSRDDGTKYEFYLGYKLSKSEYGIKLKQIINDNGGDCANNWSPECMELVAPKDKDLALRVMNPDKVYYLSTFVEDCVKQKKLIGPAAYEIKAPKSGVKMRNHSFFTPEEDEQILEYVSQAASISGPSVKGDNFWQIAHSQLQSRHTWQSLKNRYRKHLGGHTPPAVKDESKVSGEDKKKRYLPLSLSDRPQKKARAEQIENQPDERQNVDQNEDEKTENNLPQTETSLEDEAPPLVQSPEEARPQIAEGREISQIAEDQMESKGKRTKEIQRVINMLKEMTNSSQDEVLKALVAASGNWTKAKALLESGTVEAEVWAPEEDALLIELGEGFMAAADKVRSLLEKFGKESLEKRFKFLSGAIRQD